MWTSRFFWLALIPAIAAAQDGTTVGNPRWGGLIVRLQANVEPSGTSSQHLPGAVIPTADGTHRLITDTPNKRQFGYDLRAELLPDGQSLRITLGPLVQGRGSFQPEPGWTLIALPKGPLTAVLQAGNTAAIDLLHNPATGQKIVEYLTVERAALDPSRIAKEPPRDFGIDDVELFLNSPRVWLNGKLIESTAKSSGAIRAHTLWLFLPGEGTFVISLAPEPNHPFEKAGMMQGNVMTFRNGASEYRVECASPIAPGSGIYNLYLHYERGSPHSRDTEFSIGGTDKGRWLTRKE